MITNIDTDTTTRVIFYSEEPNERETRNSCWLTIVVVFVVIIFILVFSMI